MSGKKALIVDDAYFMRTLIKNALKKEGYEVVGEAKNGSEGIKMYFELKPDFVTMDINMPDISGIEATRQILSKDPKARIIAVTGSDNDEVRDEMMKAGAMEYLKKPFQPAFLLTKVEELFIEKELPPDEVLEEQEVVSNEPIVITDDVPVDDFETMELVVLNKPDENRDKPLIIKNENDQIVFPEEEMIDQEKYTLKPEKELVIESEEVSIDNEDYPSPNDQRNPHESIQEEASHLQSEQHSLPSESELVNEPNQHATMEHEVVPETLPKPEVVAPPIPDEVPPPIPDPPISKQDEPSTYIQIRPPRGRILNDPNYGIHAEEDMVEPVIHNGEVVAGSKRKKGIMGLFQNLFKKNNTH